MQLLLTCPAESQRALGLYLEVRADSFLYVHWKLWIGARDGKSVRASIIPTTRATSKVVSDLDIVYVLVVGQVVNAMFCCICQHIDQS